MFANLLRVKAEKTEDHNRKIIKRSQIRSPMGKTVSRCERLSDLPAIDSAISLPKAPHFRISLLFSDADAVCACDFCEAGRPQIGSPGFPPRLSKYGQPITFSI
jgi:hypothetical protein